MKQRISYIFPVHNETDTIDFLYAKIDMLPNTGDFRLLSRRVVDTISYPVSSLSLLGNYIGRIYAEAQNRPLRMVESVSGAKRKLKR